MEIEDHLSEAGATIVGPAGTLSNALRLIDEEKIHIALLDANLAGAPADSIAAALTRKAIPFAFVSGYGRESLPRSFSDTEALSKPFTPEQLLEVAERLVDRRAIRFPKVSDNSGS